MHAVYEAFTMPYRYYVDPDVVWDAKVRPIGGGFPRADERSPMDYVTRARVVRSRFITRILNRIYGRSKSAVADVFAGIKRKRAISATAKALFVLDDDTLRDIGIDRSDIWSVAISVVDETAGPERFKKASKTVTPEPEETAENEYFMPKAA